MMTQLIEKKREKQEHTSVWSNLNDREGGMQINNWLIVVGRLISWTDKRNNKWYYLGP